MNPDSLSRLAGFIARRSREARIQQVAGSLTFTTVLALVPLATVAFALFTAFPLFAQFQSSLQSFLADHLMPPQVNSQIFRYLDQFASKAKSLTTAGLFLLCVTGVMTMMTIEAAFNLIWRVPKSRPLAQRVLVYWSIITLGPVLFGVSLSVSSYLISRSMWISGSRGVSDAVDWALTGAALPLTAVAFTIMYVYMPNCKVQWRDAAVGGTVAAVAFETAKRVFGIYIRHMPNYTVVYGAFAAIPIFLIWVYLSWFITLVGAMIASALPAIRIGQFHRMRFPGSDLLDALNLLALLNHARERGLPGYRVLDLARMSRRDVETTTRLLDVLESQEWIAKLDPNTHSERWVLLANPRHVDLRAVFHAFVLDREELAYQASLPDSPFDSEALLAAIDARRLEVSLAEVLGAHKREAAAIGDSTVLGTA
ncbi:MAG TPA: YihY family inner membrane protein [Pararobbsia sp.]|nr:YihY family inner membrane protein [Pararobbsia sp.]